MEPMSQLQFARAANRLFVHCHDHVPCDDAGFIGGTVGFHFRNQHALVALEIEGFHQIFVERLQANAEEATLYLAGLQQALHDIAGEVRRNGETNPLIAAAAREDGGIDADQATLEIDQGAARVPHIDGGIGLNEVLVVDDAHASAANGTDDTHGRGLR